jgi:hypothetical protein
MVSDKYGFAFCHIPRTGGTSFTDAMLSVHNPKLEDYPHTPLSQFRDKLNGNVVFTKVRNPFDRAVSLFHRTKPMWNNNFNRFLESDFHWRKRETLCPAEDYLLEKSKELFNCVLRFETLIGDTKRLLDYLGIDFDMALYPHWTHTSHNPYREYYTDDLRKIVESRCAWEIERFGYSY